MKRLPHPNRGFTLVEILIVVVIIGVLAALALPLLADATNDARKTAFAADTKIFAEAMERYRLDYGVFPPDSSSGVLPLGFEDYIEESKWVAGTPVGGVWDTEFNDSGVAAAVGVHFDGTGDTRDDIYMNFIDDMVDDGDVNTGAFRKLAADRYYFVVDD